MHVDGTDVYRRVGDGKLRLDVRSSVAGWEDHAVFTQRVRNYSDKPVEIEVRRRYVGHVVFRSALTATLHDFQSPQFVATIAAGQRAELLVEVVTRQGRNAEQNNVTLEAGEVRARN